MIRATIIGPDRITACGITARCPFQLARMLIAVGHDPTLPMQTAWQDGRESLRFANLAVAAELIVRESPTDGPRLVRFRPPPQARAAATDARAVFTGTPAVGGARVSPPGGASATAAPDTQAR